MTSFALRGGGAAPPVGARPGRIPPRKPPRDGLAGEKPVDLVKGRHEIWPAQDQAARATCIAFAVAGCIELLRAGTGSTIERVSPQFLYWYMRTRPWPDLPPGWESGATKLNQAQAVLAQQGWCPLSLCAYPSSLRRDAPVEGPEPSDDAKKAGRARLMESKYYGFDDDATRPPNVARLVLEQLQAGRPAAIAIPQFDADPTDWPTNWTQPPVVSSGVVRDPAPGWVPEADPALAGHAVCVVGFEPDPKEPTGGWFIVRNSVGGTWGFNAPDPGRPRPPHVPCQGYGAISASYVDTYCWEILSPTL